MQGKEALYCGPLGIQDLNETPVVSGQTQYSNDPMRTRTFTHPGAALTRVCFTGFDVENYDDTVEICDGADHIVEVLTGRKNPVGGLASFCFAWIQGDTAKVVFQTDGSVTGTGFVLRRVESRNAFTQDARFPGQWLDRDTEVKSSTTGALLYSGLHQNWHREFDPDTGRYLTPDPLGLLAGSNLFASAHNDPLHSADPEGLAPYLPPQLREKPRVVGGTVVLPFPAAAGLSQGVAATRPFWNAGWRGLLSRIRSILHFFTKEKEKEDCLKESELAPSELNVDGIVQPELFEGTVEDMAEQLKKDPKTFWEESVKKDGKIKILEIEGKRYLENGNHRYQAAIRSGQKIPSSAYEVKKGSSNWPIYRFDRMTRMPGKK